MSDGGIARSAGAAMSAGSVARSGVATALSVMASAAAPPGLTSTLPAPIATGMPCAIAATVKSSVPELAVAL